MNSINVSYGMQTESINIFKQELNKFSVGRYVIGNALRKGRKIFGKCVKTNYIYLPTSFLGGHQYLTGFNQLKFTY